MLEEKSVKTTASANPSFLDLPLDLCIRLLGIMPALNSKHFYYVTSTAKVAVHPP